MKMFRLIFKKLLLISVISGLIISNILTLLDNGIHEAAFDTLKIVLTSVVAKENLSRILSNSPTQKYKAMEVRHIEFKQKRINTVKKFSKQIFFRTERLALKSFSSFLPRITPIIGTAITVGLTIMEIQDDCQTLKDLNELNVDFEIDKMDETTVCGIDITDITN
jgi:hypothetical protein